MIDEVLPGLIRIPLSPFGLGNAYLLGDVLIDSGAPFSAGQLFTALKGREVTAHALTHAHFDHQGSSHAICDELQIPLWCGEGDRAAMESGELFRLMPDPKALLARFGKLMAGPAHPVTRSLQEGDLVGGFTVISTPGHTPGHLAYWREEDRALVLGDVLFHQNPLTFRRGLQEPFRMATFDPVVNRQSGRKLADLKPSVICFGHGPPLRDTQLFISYVNSLPKD